MSHVRMTSPWRATPRKATKVDQEVQTSSRPDVVFALEYTRPYFYPKSNGGTDTVSTRNAKQIGHVHSRVRSRETHHYASTMRSARLESLMSCVELFPATNPSRCLSNENCTRSVNEFVSRENLCCAYFSLGVVTASNFRNQCNSI